MTKKKPLAKNNWYEWYDSLISHFYEFVKKTASDVIEKIMKLKLFETKTNNNTRRLQINKNCRCLLWRMYQVQK